MKYAKSLLAGVGSLWLLAGCGVTSADTEGPVFKTAGTFTLTEGISDVVTLSAEDTNGVVFAIAGGADADKFMIDAANGTLRFKTAPDFEDPSDADGNSTYELIVQATDEKGNSTTLPLKITVTDDASDNGPTFTTADRVTMQENRKLDFTVHADPQSGEAVYAISGGPDAGKITIDPDSGTLSFVSFRPDFDFPSDADKNNRYEISISASDENNHTTMQHFTVVVTDDPNDPVPTRKVFKTGQDDGPYAGLAFGDDRDFTVKTENDQRVIVAGNRMWEDSPHSVGAENQVGFYGAQDYCNALNYGGYDDWRVPSRHELAEMLNYGKVGQDNMFDDIFNYRSGANYWTSQEKKSAGGNGSGLGWSISFSDGGVHDRDKGVAYNVRCVRGKKISDHLDFSVDNDVVIDNKTGIMWQNAEFIGGRTWEEAKEHCVELVFQGYDDWRLPNINELRSIMPYDNNEILFEHLSPIGDGNLDSGHSWSSTEADANHAYYNLNDWDEETNRDSLIIMYEEYPKTDNGNMMLNRCIRGGHL